MSLVSEIQTLGDWLRELRARLGLSQRAFARKLGMATSTVARWELGLITPHPLHRRILAHLGRDAGLPPMPVPEEEHDDE